MHPQATFYMYAMYMQCALYAIPVCCYLKYLVPTYQCVSVHLLEPSISQSSRAGRWRPRYHSRRHCIIASGFLENSFKMKQIHIKVCIFCVLILDEYISQLLQSTLTCDLTNISKHCTKKEVYLFSKAFAPSFS